LYGAFFVHLAAQAGVPYSLQNFQAYPDSNLTGFINLLEGCHHSKIEHLVFASSSSVYGTNTKVPFAVSDNVDRPISLDPATKKAKELMAYSYSHLYNLSITGLRFFTVYCYWGRPDIADFKFVNLSVSFPTNLCLFLGKNIRLALNLRSLISGGDKLNCQNYF